MKKITVKTTKQDDIIDITDSVNKNISIKQGLCNIFSMHTTASICIIENEKGMKYDLIKTLESLAPFKADYLHNQLADDLNGSSHVKATIIGQSVTVPIENNKLMLGKWQKIVLIEFDCARIRNVLITNISK
jgi:secondary thiamine-phosphate synthase enzyme